ncbi:MAG TPA: hypothetical protein VN131_00070, partial [Mobilitalea sp.]|nr:hypothetical protein [Mobilitalea sp.]
MKKINITWKDGIEDTTSYLFSFAKALGTAIKNSPYHEAAEDIIATSGFAFRMWIAEKDLNPSAMCEWELDSQKPWVDSGGFTCDYVGRYWDQGDIEEKERDEAIQIITSSLDRGIPAIVWNICGTEWGLVTGYNDEKKEFNTLSITGVDGTMPYQNLGNEEVPILSVLTITGRTDKPQEEIQKDAIKLAVTHLKGEEGGKNVTGLKIYPVFLEFFKDRFDNYLSWNMEYHLGTYGGLKYYAYLYFKKQGLDELAELYQIIYGKWKAAFDLIRYRDITGENIRNNTVNMLTEAYEAE